MSNEADSDSGSISDDELQEFVLVEFIHRGRKKKCESVDIVPSNWLQFDNIRKRCVTKFLPSPYKPEDIEMLHDLIQKKADAPVDWPVFPVEVRGRAKTYKRAEEKIRTLEKGENAFTTDDESATEIKARMHNVVRQRQLKAQEKLLREEFLSIKEITNNESQGNGQPTLQPTVQASQQQVNFAVPSASRMSIISSTSIREIQQPREDTVPGDVVDANEHNGLLVNLTAQVSGENVAVVEQEVSDNDNRNEDIIVELPEPDADDLIQQLSLPIFQLGNYESKSDFETLVINKFDQISDMLAKMYDSLEEIKKKQNDASIFMMDKKVVQKSNSKIDFVKRYQLELPIGDMDTFKTFDASLSKNLFLKTDVYTELTSLADDLACITKSFSAMLRRFITKDLAMQFTAARKARDPSKDQAEKFKDTAFYECMSVVMTNVSKRRNVQVTDKDLIKGLSSILCAAKKWE